MLATAGPVPTGPAWALELKWDGMRALAYVEGDAPESVTLVSRNQRAVTRSFPELAEALAAAVGGRGVTLDGEIVALSRSTAERAGRPSFDRLQQRIGVTRPSRTRQAEVPVTFVAFDVLALDGELVTHRPWTERRALLDELGLEAHPRLTVTPSMEGLDPAAALDLAAAHDMEGVVAKRRDAAYQPGRSRAWVKTPLWRSTEAVIGGWVRGRGRHHGTVGAVLLGLGDGAGRLRYIGHVGTGFSDSARDQLRDLLLAAETSTSPFDAPVPEAAATRWCSPALVGEARFRAWTVNQTTGEHELLRHASWRGLRHDRDASELLRDGDHR